MGHYLINFLMATTATIIFLYLVYFFIRHVAPFKAGVLGSKKLPSSNPLQVESVLSLEPRKNLYVVRSGQERFLIATTMDKTELLTTLKTEASDGVLSEVVMDHPEQSSLSQSVTTRQEVPMRQGWASVWEQLRLSFRMVVLARFPQWGEK